MYMCVFLLLMIKKTKIRNFVNLLLENSDLCLDFVISICFFFVFANFLSEQHFEQVFFIHKLGNFCILILTNVNTVFFAFNNRLMVIQRFRFKTKMLKTCLLADPDQ